MSEPTEPTGPTESTEPTGPTESTVDTVDTVDTEGASDAPPSRAAWWREHSELGICGLLLVLAILVLTDALSLPPDFTQRGPVGPKAVPVLVGSLLIVVALVLARDVLRGGKGEAEGGEDVEATSPTDWHTVLLLAAAFLAHVVLIDFAGFPIAGMVLFWGSAYALGSRAYVRDPLLAAGLAVLAWFAFDELLGVPLPGGPLLGVL